MKTVFKLIEDHGLTLHGDIEHFAEIIRADERKQVALDKKAENARELGLDYEPSAKVRDFWEGYVPEPVTCPVCKAKDSPYPNCGHILYVDPPAAQRQCEGCDKIAKP